MRIFSLFATLTGMFVCSMPTFATASQLVSAPIEKVFIPQGFDDNDKVEIIVHGHFANTCYKMGPVSATLNKELKKITVKAKAHYYAGATCLQVLVPFTKSVELGAHVAAGTYQVEVATQPEIVATLKVARATRPEADDHFYASVYSADVERSAEGTFELVLKGQHPHMFIGCVKFDRIETSLAADNVLVVMPITRITDGDECIGSNALGRFEEREVLETPLQKGEYLLHVRVLDGNSVNQFLEVE